MDRPAIGEYVRHRLTVAGYAGKPLFNGSCIDMIYRGSGGVPRLINVLCHKSLLAAYGPGRKTVSPQDVRLAIEDTEGAHKLMPRWLFWPFARGEGSAIHLPASSEDES
jgi:MSHA biogenesis protein MshM